MLQLNSLVKAIQSLEVALTRWEATPTDQEIRDRVVQRFEYTYEFVPQDVAQATAGDVSYPKRGSRIGLQVLDSRGG